MRAAYRCVTLASTPPSSVGCSEGRFLQDTLDMGGCSQATIMEASLAHLAGIHTLYAADCPQLTAAAYAHLAGAVVLRG